MSATDKGNGLLPGLRKAAGGQARRLAAACLAALLVASVLTAWPSYGAAPSLDRIRVAIFINLPGKYTLDTPFATLASESGLQVGLREPDGNVPLLTVGAGEQVRFALDGYSVIVAETADLNAALGVMKRLQGSSAAVTVHSLQLNGKTVYRVVEGGYASAGEASTALGKWSADSGLTALTGGAAGMKLAGPLHLEAGPYATLADARKAAQSFGASGVEAYAAFKPSAKAGEGPAYAVLVGAAADAAGLSSVRSAAADVQAGANLRALGADERYVLVRDDHTLTQSQTPSRLFLLPAGGQAKAWVSPQGEGGIKLAERYDRSYRGGFELSGFNNRLAVVNELPFEQYLYAVVGGEMPASWPAEALKAQAVAARSYALFQGFGFEIAHVVDSVLSQTYGGIGFEKPATIAAVDATKGEVIMHEGKIVEAVFSSNAGGMTADPSEIWASSVAYLGSVPSPDDASEEGLYSWYRVVLPDSRTGYIREDLLVPAGSKTSAGSEIMTVKGSDVAVRPIPLIQSEVQPVARVNDGTRVVALEKVKQSNEMSWVRGPFTSEALVTAMNGRANTPISGPIRTLEIGARGPSGRAIEIVVNGGKLDIRTPDSLRSALGGLPSTRFEIDETGRVAMLGDGGRTREKPADSNPVYAVGANGEVRELSDPGLYILNGEGSVRAATKEAAFRFVGTGYGHGVGMSQWGARGLADQGYDYQSIVKYYYKNVTIAKE